MLIDEVQEHPAPAVGYSASPVRTLCIQISCYDQLPSASHDGSFDDLNALYKFFLVPVRRYICAVDCGISCFDCNLAATLLVRVHLVFPAHVDYSCSVAVVRIRVSFILDASCVRFTYEKTSTLLHLAYARARSYALILLLAFICRMAKLVADLRLCFAPLGAPF